MRKVSVAICTYNGQSFIREQLESIFNQTVLPDEIIICDDQSTDTTVTILEELKEKTNIPIKIYINKVNLGYIKNFEKCLGLCQGDILFLADQDDYWVKNKVELILNEFDKNLSLQLVFTDAMLVDVNLHLISESLWESIDFNKSEFPENKLGRIAYLSKKTIATGATMAIKRDLFINAVPFPNEFIHDEWLLWNAILNNKEIMPLNQALISYRQHLNNQIGAKKLRFSSLLNINRELGKQIIKNSTLINELSKNDNIEEEMYYLKERASFLNSRNKLCKNRFLRSLQLVIRFLFDKKYSLKNYMLYFNGKKTILSDFIRK